MDTDLAVKTGRVDAFVLAERGRVFRTQARGRIDPVVRGPLSLF